MYAARWVVVALGSLAWACTGGANDDGVVGEADAGEGAFVVPEGLVVRALPGGNGVLELTALTLREGADGAELYVALRNVGDEPACSAAVSVELFDASEQSLAAAISGLLTRRLHRVTEGSDVIAACIEPGEISMAALTDLPAELRVQDVRHVVYRCPYHALDVGAGFDGLEVRELERVASDASTAYRGTLVNVLESAVRGPSVTVFPVNRVGRPLGVASASSSVELAPGGSWAFETEGVDEEGVDQAAFAAGEIVR